MKEYTIYFKHGNCKGYTLTSYKSLNSAKSDLYNIVNYEMKFKRAFYVDNDFFDNSFELNNKVFYICILERDVGDWKKSSSQETISDKNLTFLNNF